VTKDEAIDVLIGMVYEILDSNSTDINSDYVYGLKIAVDALVLTLEKPLTRLQYKNVALQNHAKLLMESDNVPLEVKRDAKFKAACVDDVIKYATAKVESGFDKLIEDILNGRTDSQIN